MKEHKALRSALAALAAAVLAGTAVLPAFAAGEETLPGGEPVTPDDGSYETEETFPASFDLRNVNGKNYVTPVRYQGGWGTCWCFSATAACEISAVYEISNTFDVEVDVDNVDFSELHTAWFSAQPLPEDNTHYPAQAGEGGTYISLLEDDGQYNLATGGDSFLAGSLYSMGIGPVTEEMVPYKNKSGNVEKTPEGDPWYYSVTNEDWSVDEEYRFMSGLEFEDCNLLPSPAVIDNDENGQPRYTYNEDATNVIKSELMKGRGVSIGFYTDVGSRIPMPTEVSKYLSENYSHYTYDIYESNHGVCIVGWDDNYSRDNFRQGVAENGESMTPPADGAWIVKNSWGNVTNEFPNKNNWGTDGTGYFYLSYYDRSLCDPESFNFYVDNYLSGQEYRAIDQHDLMPTKGINGLVFTVPVLMANVFDVKVDEVLTAVSTETCQPNTTVTYDIYKLNKDSGSPSDGELVSTFEAVYEYPGYHRTNLPEGIEFSEGDRYCIMVLQETEHGYVIEIKQGLSYKGALQELEDKDLIEQIKSFGAKALAYSVGVINPGESYLFMPTEDGGYDWFDWVDEVETIHESFFSDSGDAIAYDNLPIKGYATPVINEDDSSDSQPDSSDSQPDSEPDSSDSEPDTSDSSDSQPDSTAEKPSDANPATGARAAAFILVILSVAAIIVIKKK